MKFIHLITYRHSVPQKLTKATKVQTEKNDQHHPILNVKINYKFDQCCQKPHPALEPLINTLKIKPLKSKKYRVYKIIENLTEHFKQCWEHQKSTSSKLSFYHSIKTRFGREPYLDLCKGFSRRYSATKLRISAHDLQIEQGRYANQTREQRICSWCKTSMGLCVIEDENHVLYDCDLYTCIVNFAQSLSLISQNL